MDLDILKTFIKPESYIMIPVLYLIGLFLRQTPNIPIWTHAWIKVLIGVTSCMIYYGPTIQAFVQGILVAGAAVLIKDLIHKTIDQTQTKKEDNKL
ncbi:phage holin family protein [Neobacillus niacini]|uniref:phage holin family protein n=1 Tax=Neobacillus niacini TaxID=86668 RepID=UPI002FFF86AD